MDKTPATSLAPDSNSQPVPPAAPTPVYGAGPETGAPTHHGSVVWMFLVGLLIGLLVGIGGYWAWQKYYPAKTTTATTYTAPSTTTSTTTTATPQSASTSTTGTTTTVTGDWKTVTDDVSGISFKVPPTAALGTVESSIGLNYTYFAEKVSELPDSAPNFGDKATAEADQAALAKGEMGSQKYLHPFVDSMKLIKLSDGTSAKTFVSFGGGLDCMDRQAMRTVVTFHNGYRVYVQFSAADQELTQQNPTYFANDPQCTPGDTKTLLLKSSDFYTAVSYGKLTNLANTWYTSFDAMLSTISFTK